MIKPDTLSLFWFWYVFMPGLIYVWVNRTFRGKNIAAYLWESFVCGIILAASGIVLTLVVCYFSGGYSDALLFLSALLYVNKEGLLWLLEWNELAFFYLSLSCLEIYMLAAGFGVGFRRVAEMGLFANKKPRITPSSALDIEMLEFRKRNEAPWVTIYLKNGVKVEGECCAYTFTEPREISIIADCGKIVVPINAEVVAIELVGRKKRNQGGSKLVPLPRH
ncbi:hypothetical protein [Desulfofundulus salinus]|uniref:Uncharacterized protein n=1 Tax=Desulfofundulus salinus TaxID=2419843 RepID=A0A494WSI7_9FIRM|nr:hypothetical protein [Desulfofundulus salinum]RKO65703.1 hypothetical protein D7024_01110 [Desulfofundulus salinum]